MKLTIYPNKQSFVSEKMSIDILKGINKLTINGIPKSIDSHSLIFSFDNPNVIVQTYSLHPDEEHEGLLKANIVLESIDNLSCYLDLFYKINGISYDVYYNFLQNNNKTISINGWVEINNYSGADLRNVELQIVINQDNNNIIFTLNNSYILMNNEKVNISFLSKSDVEYGIKYVIPYNRSSIIECISIQNSEDKQLGIPLMAGKVTLYFKDKENSLQFIGEDNIDVYFPDDEIVFEISENYELAKVVKSIGEDYLYNVSIQNTSNKTLLIDVEADFQELEVIESNAVWTKDENNISHVLLKIMPMSIEKIFYKLNASEIIPSI